MIKFTKLEIVLILAVICNFSIGVAALIITLSKNSCETESYGKISGLPGPKGERGPVSLYELSDQV